MVASASKPMAPAWLHTVEDCTTSTSAQSLILESERLMNVQSEGASCGNPNTAKIELSDLMQKSAFALLKSGLAHTRLYPESTEKEALTEPGWRLGANCAYEMPGSAPYCKNSPVPLA